MPKTNGKTEPNLHDDVLDVEHELPAAADDATAALAADVQRLQDDAGKLKAERDMLLDRLARLQAEFENYRKRAAREQADFREYALADAIRKLMPIVDSLDRALSTEQRGDEFHAGIELIDRQLHDALSKLGVQPIETLGKRFDPNLHEAVEVVETTDLPDQHVVGELQRGYKLKDRLLRPAMVRVSRNPKH